MARLIIYNSDGSSTAFDLADHDLVTVGRELDNMVVLTDPHSSRHHFHIETHGQRHTLVNHSTTHGTLVDGRQAARIELHGGEQIRAGSTILVFEKTPGQSGFGSPKTQQAAHTTRRSPTPALAPEPDAPGSISSARLEARQSVHIAADNEESAPNLLATSTPREAMSATMISDVGGAPSGELRRRLMLIQDIGQQMVTQFDLDKLFDFLLDKIFDILHPDNGLIGLIDRDTKQLVPMAVRQRKLKTDRQGKRRLHISQTLLRRVFQKKIAILSADTQSEMGSNVSVMALDIRSAMCVPMILQDELLGIIHVDSETVTNSFNQQDLDLLTVLANQAALCIHTARLHDQIVREETLRANLSRFHSPVIVDKIASNEIRLELGGRSVEVAVLYSDIRDFTSLSERTDPKALVEFLNQYFSAMADIVFDCQGTFDKFIGDALIAVFGSPVADPEDAYNAACCAQRMVEQVERMDFDIGRVGIGIGLNWGPVIHGNIGSEKVLQYTVIGDVVNTTARLSDLAAPGQVVLSPSMLAKLGDRVETRALGKVELKGKSEPLETFELVHCRD